MEDDVRPVLADIAHRHGVLLVADNTFLGPALLRPLEHGADLVLRGVRTLPLRSAKGSENAIALARFLEADGRVDWVSYPGLVSHPDHAIASRLLGDRCGAMVTFAPRGGVEGMAAFTDHLRLCDIGVSLGDVFTLVYPRPKDGGIVRVSVGCEDIGDLLEDFALGLSFVR